MLPGAARGFRKASKRPANRIVCAANSCQTGHELTSQTKALNRSLADPIQNPQNLNQKVK
jgi:hypothetical protein